MQFSGLFAWLLWRGVYLLKLPGWDRTEDRALLADGHGFTTRHCAAQDRTGQGIIQEHYETGQTRPAMFRAGDEEAEPRARTPQRWRFSGDGDQRVMIGNTMCEGRSAS